MALIREARTFEIVSNLLLMIDPVSSAVTSLFVSYRKHAETLQKADYHDLRDVFK